MSNNYFQFKQFRINQEKTGMKVTTDGCLFGAYAAQDIQNKATQPLKILDIGTGTGLLTLMILQKNPQHFIDSVEINSDAFIEASHNFQSSPWKTQIKAHHLPIQDYAPNDLFDVIICNPPFFKNNLKGSNQKKNEALHNDLLSFEALSQSIHRLLNKNGIAYVLLPEYEMHQLIDSLQKLGLYLKQQVLVKNNDAGNIFRVIGTFNRDQEAPTTTEIVIRDHNQEYTSYFKYLLDDYYL